MLMKNIDYIINFSKRNYLKITDKFQKKLVVRNTQFKPLSPTDCAEDCDIYLSSIDWALKNRKTIKNIAISGPYGSGKSSIIQTYIKKHRESENYLKRLLFPKFKFLNISLATFKDSKHNELPDCTDLLRLIELSILQQLFFHEKDSKIPDSRFKKIKSNKKIKLFGYSFGIILFLISILYLLFPEFLAKFSFISIPENLTNIVHYLSSIVSILGLFCIIYKFSRSFIGLSIKKLNLRNGEIEIDKDISKSILNNHLDEIIYFFEVTKFNVVIIEDLDRFEQTEVFTKLREINLLINSSNKIKREIVFIYAIKDDMFLDKDRTKFFDFMIPIIPVIDFSNSGNKLRTIINLNKYTISEELIDDLSLFIDDMRLLYNIMNEFYIYSEKVEGNLEHDKLLSMIVYKNIFPNDFTHMSQNEGDLYKTISKKSEYIKNEIARLEIEIAEKKKIINQAEQIQLTDIVELRTLYLSKIVEKIIVNHPFVHFIVGNKRFTISELAKTDLFDYYQNNIRYSYNSNYSGYESNFQYNALEIEKEINPHFTYKKRKEIIQNKSQINNFKKDIEKINEQKNQIRKIKLKDLLSKKQISIETDSDKKSDLINILLRNGYIDENYMDYISVFHEGALTKTDYQFLINVKTEKLSNFDYKLTKTDELIKKINEFSFEKEYVLNFDLVDAFLKSYNNQEKKKRLFEQLCNEEDFTIGFIDEYINRTPSIERFIEVLCDYWDNIWKFIESESFYSEEKKELYFKYIIQYADVMRIVEIFLGNIDYINNYSKFLNINRDEESLKLMFDGLEVKFNSIDLESPKSLIDYIYVGSFYSINIEMIRSILLYKEIYDSKLFEEMNFTCIISSDLKHLINYVESNIEFYIESVYLKLEKNSEEKIENYYKLLNYEELSIKSKEKIIIKVNTIIDDLSKIIKTSVCDLLLTYLKIETTWDNILDKFEREDNILDGILLNYINNTVIAELLSKTRMTTEKKNDKSKYDELCKTIIHTTEISFESYELLTKSIPWHYESFDVEKISTDKIIVLIKNNCLNPTLKTYNFLKSNYDGINILLLEIYLEKYVESIEELSIDSSDLELVIKSNKIGIKEKFKFINSCEDDIILSNTENIKGVSNLITNFNLPIISNSLILSLLMNKNTPQLNKISIFNNYISLVTKDTIVEILSSMSGVYKEIIDTSKKATLENNALNHKFLDNLIQLNYISSFSEKEKGLRVNHKRKE